MANPAGVRDYLFCLGINLPRDPRRRARIAALAIRRHAVLCGRGDPLCLDASQRLPAARAAGMARGFGPRRADFRGRLRLPVLGRAACAFRHRRRDTRDHSCIHHAFGNHFSSHPETHRSPCARAACGYRWRSGADEPFRISR